MKSIKRFIPILIILGMMLSNAFMFTVSAASLEVSDIVVTEAENLDGENELQPMAANGCRYVKFSNSMADTVAKQHGYSGAEAFKKDFNVSSEGNMYRDTVTNEVVIITTTGAVINTDFYGGWK